MRKRTSIGLPMLALFIGLMSGAAIGQEKEFDFTGTWKCAAIEPGVELDFVLIKIESKDGKLQGEILSINALPPKTKLKSIKTVGDRMIVTLEPQEGRTFDVVAIAAKDAKAKQLNGFARSGNRVFPTRLLRSEDKRIDPEKARRELPERDKFQKASGTEDAKMRAALLKGLVFDKASSDPMVIFAGRVLIQDLATQVKPDTKLIDEIADHAMKIIKPYGLEMQTQVAVELIETLTRAEKTADLAERHAKTAKDLLADEKDVEVKVEGYVAVAEALARQKKTTPLAITFVKDARKIMGPKFPARGRLAAAEILIDLLEKTGKEDEAKKVAGELPKLNEELDEEFLKTNIPFKPEKFKGRRGKSKRVALVELFTGAQCPPCVAADVAFDAFLKSYDAKDVVLLQYHVHIPLPDPLTAKDSVTRSRYYGIRGTPTYLLDGEQTRALQMGGGRAQSRGGYENGLKAINEKLEADPKADIELSAKKKGDAIEIKADVSKVQKPGEKVRLRLVLIEDLVRYPGRNGQRMHHHVVRDFPGGVEGLALKKESDTQSVKVDLKELRKSLAKELDEQAKIYPFPDKQRPMELEKLKVVAFVQNDETKEILNAVQVDVE